MPKDQRIKVNLGMIEVSENERKALYWWYGEGNRDGLAGRDVIRRHFRKRGQITLDSIWAKWHEAGKPTEVKR